jgi:S-(hydroxymethyl)glutathione dehydrogenase/alcohol dehydrogenase
MPRFVDFYLSGKLRLDDLLETHVDLEGVNGALQKLKTGEVARQVIGFAT